MSVEKVINLEGYEKSQMEKLKIGENEENHMQFIITEPDRRSQFIQDVFDGKVKLNLEGIENFEFHII